MINLSGTANNQSGQGNSNNNINNQNNNNNIKPISTSSYRPPSEIQKQKTFTLDLSEPQDKLEVFKYLECKSKTTKYVQAKFSNSNKCLLISREDGYLELINFNNNKLITEFKFHDDVIMDFDIDSKNGIILTASIDGYASVINIDTFQVINKFHPLNPTRNLNTCKIMNVPNPNYDPKNASNSLGNNNINNSNNNNNSSNNAANNINNNDKNGSEMFTEHNINNYVYNLFNPNASQNSGGFVQLDIDSLFVSSDNNTTNPSNNINNNSSINNKENNNNNKTKSKDKEKEIQEIKKLSINKKDKELSFSLISGGQDSKLVTTTNQKEGGFDTLTYNSFNGEQISIFQDHFGPINTLAVNENAKLIASGAEDATIRIYKLDNFVLNHLKDQRK